MTIQHSARTIAGTAVIAAALAVGSLVPTGTALATPRAQDRVTITPAAVDDPRLVTGRVLATQYASTVKTWLVEKKEDGRVWMNLVDGKGGWAIELIDDREDHPQPGPNGVVDVVHSGTGPQFTDSVTAGVVGANVRGVVLHTDSDDVTADVVEGRWLAAWEGKDHGDDADGPIPATVTLADGSSYETAV